MSFFKHLPVLSLLDVTANLEQLQATLPQLVTTLPTNAIDGQETLYLASEASGVVWRFRYRAVSSSTHKWEFVGGSALYAEAQGNVSTESEVYVALAGGPSITLPLAGDYELGLVLAGIEQNTKAGQARATLKLGAAAAADSESVLFEAAIEPSQDGSASRSMMRTNLSAEEIMVYYKRITAGKATFGKREIWCRPIRVG